MKEQIPLGELLDFKGQQRDAIHIAISPVVAGEQLEPGDDIGFLDVENGIVVRSATKHIGIVDPFLKKLVEKDQRFWMLLYPNTITSLRHDWSHPAFVGRDETDASKRWITDFAAKLGYSYEELMRIAHRYEERGDWEMDNSERYKDYWEEFDEFWNHWENVTGEVATDRGAPFTCAC